MKSFKDFWQLRMPENDGSGGGGGDGSGGAGGANTQDPASPDRQEGGEGDGGEGNPDPKHVPKRNFDRAMDQLKEANRRLKALEDEKKARDEESLRKTNDWKTLAERYKTEAEEKEKRINGLQTNLILDRKFQAVRDACVKLGLRPESVDDLEGRDMSDVEVETTSTGRINVLGADEFAKNLKVLKPHWFGGGAAPVNTRTPALNGGNKGGGGGDRWDFDPSAPDAVQKLVQLSHKASQSRDYREYEAADKAYRAFKSQRGN